MRIAFVAVLLLPVLAGCDTLDVRRTAADLASGACRGVGSCTVTCPDGSTLDGRPAGARCRR